MTVSLALLRKALGIYSCLFLNSRVTISAEIQLHTTGCAFLCHGRSLQSKNLAVTTGAHRPLLFPHSDKQLPRASTYRSSTTLLPALSLSYYDSAVALAQIPVAAYTASLTLHPLPTKSLTSGLLCGIGDVIAQRRDPNRGEFNLGRTVRFASKGCVGGIIWTRWYDWLDGFLSYDSPTSLYVLAGVTLPSFALSHPGVVTTALSIILEQFVWCPFVYGTFEIPVSTLMNGGSPGGIKDEVDAKLNGLLVSNAKVWTLANVLIYGAPLEWRLFIGNVVDVFWQSVVSNVSADCGRVGDDVCDIDLMEEDASFYAEKSRI